MSNNADLALLIVTLLSGLLSGLVVAVVQWIVVSRQEAKRAKIAGIAELVAYSFVMSRGPYEDADTSRFVAALNKIPVIFYYNRELLNSYRDLRNGFNPEKFSRFVKLLLEDAGVKQVQIDDAIIESPLTVTPKIPK